MNECLRCRVAGGDANFAGSVWGHGVRTPVLRLSRHVHVPVATILNTKCGSMGCFPFRPSCRSRLINISIARAEIETPGFRVRAYGLSLKHWLKPIPEISRERQEMSFSSCDLLMLFETKYADFPLPKSRLLVIILSFFEMFSNACAILWVLLLRPPFGSVERKIG